MRDDLAAVALALAPLTGRKDRWQEHFKGWNMEQSEFLRSWVSRGVRQGVQQKAQQETTDHRLMLEKILKERFPKQASAQSLAKLASEPDLEVLKKWTVDAAVAKSWKAFRDAAGWK